MKKEEVQNLTAAVINAGYSILTIKSAGAYYALPIAPGYEELAKGLYKFLEQAQEIQAAQLVLNKSGLLQNEISRAPLPDAHEDAEKSALKLLRRFARIVAETMESAAGMPRNLEISVTQPPRQIAAAVLVGGKIAAKAIRKIETASENPLDTALAEATAAEIEEAAEKIAAGEWEPPAYIPPEPIDCEACADASGFLPREVGVYIKRVYKGAIEEHRREPGDRRQWLNERGNMTPAIYETLVKETLQKHAVKLERGDRVDAYIDDDAKKISVKIYGADGKETQAEYAAD